ncbi:hypothetical protein KKH23_10500 [Patescibacteria group bacterium]|nr:hypothetical protein [Patescibacteria group bacterium]
MIDAPNNKLMTGVILLMLSLGLSWFIWATSGIYQGSTERALNKSAIIEVNKGLCSIAVDIDSIQRELADQKRTVAANQKEILGALSRIENNKRN